MKSTRRSFLTGGVAAGLIPTVSCGEAPQGAISIPDPERWIPEVTLDEASFPFGIQIGDATFDSVICSVQTDVVSWKMLLMRVEEGVWVLDRMVELPSSVDGFGQWELDALNPDTLYSIVVFTESGRSSVSEFRTALEIGENRIIRFGATSCLGGNWSWPSLSIAASQRYDFFCFLGDAVYADGSTSKTEYWQHWSRTLSQQGFQDITSSTSLVCTWDDHEVDNNWSWEDEGIDTRFSNAISTFRRALPQREGPDGTGIWRRLDWGETLSLFILDGRGERRDGNYISPEQMDWLKESLRTTTAYFSVILNPVPITDYSTLLGSTQSEDRWEGYEQRAEILSYIEDQDITGVVFVSGDFHFGQICRVSQTGEVGSELHEVLVGPGGSFLNPMGSMIPEGAQFLVGLSEWNYTEFVCDPDLGTIAVSFFSDEGELLAERVISV